MASVSAVRVAEEAEYSAIGALTAEAYRSTGFDSADPYMEALRDPASRPADCTVLAVDDESGRLLGAITYIPAGSAVAELARPGEAEIRMLAVREDGRGRGAAARLVRGALGRAEQEHRSAMVLCVVDHNATARSLYERLGFVRAPALDWSPVPSITLVGYRHGLR